MSVSTHHNTLLTLKVLATYYDDEQKYKKKKRVIFYPYFLIRLIPIRFLLDPIRFLLEDSYLGKWTRITPYVINYYFSLVNPFYCTYFYLRNREMDIRCKINLSHLFILYIF